VTDAPTALTDPVLGAEGIAHGFFTRAGGVSDGIHAGLNIGVGSCDDQAKVRENRARAARALGLDGDALVTLYQIHGTDVVHATAPFGEERPKGDGLVTDRPGIALGIATADCAPVLFADAGAGVIGACHAGWKGAMSGIVEATVEAMVGLGAERDRIAAVLGPCIHQVSYEVGPEFRDRLIAAEGPDADGYFAPSPERAGHFMFDLPAYVLARIARSGAGTIGHVAEDTYADPRRFFSYRRATHREERGPDGTIDYGRLLSAIALTG
jgi:YfiH family protein